MSRVQIPVVVQDAVGNAVNGASVTIVNRQTGLAPVVYTTETGGAARSLPLTTDVRGRPPESWVDRAAYQITVTAAAIGTDVLAWDAAAARDASVDAVWLSTALRPSQGAGDGVEALRAIGTAAGQVARGSDTAAHEALTGTAHIGSLVSALPSNPVNGQECFLRTAAMGAVTWYLRYDGFWRFVGGPPLIARDDSLATITSTAWTATPNTPSLTVPAPGVYHIAHGAAIAQNNALSAYMAARVNGEIPANENLAVGAAAYYTTGVSTESERTLTTLTITSLYRVTGGTGYFERRWISVTPIYLLP